MGRRRRILPTYLPQQCLHLVGVTLNREQQIRVAQEEKEKKEKEKKEKEEEKKEEEQKEKEEAPKVKTHTLVTSLHAVCQIAADCTIQHDTVLLIEGSLVLDLIVLPIASLGNGMLQHRILKLLLKLAIS